MKTYAIYDISSGEINRFYKGLNPVIQCEQTESFVECSGLESQETHWVNDGTLTEYTAEQSKSKRKEWFVGESWSNASMSWVIHDQALLQAEVANALRLRRNELLAKSDYTQMPDVPLSSKELWDNYRQELRDLPQTYAAITSLDEVTWPTPPES